MNSHLRKMQRREKGQSSCCREQCSTVAPVLGVSNNYCLEMLFVSAWRFKHWNPASGSNRPGELAQAPLVHRATVNFSRKTGFFEKLWWEWHASDNPEWWTRNGFHPSWESVSLSMFVAAIGLFFFFVLPSPLADIFHWYREKKQRSYRSCACAPCSSPFDRQEKCGQWTRQGQDGKDTYEVTDGIIVIPCRGQLDWK